MTASFLTWATGKLVVLFIKVWTTEEGTDMNVGQVILQRTERHQMEVSRT